MVALTRLHKASTSSMYDVYDSPGNWTLTELLLRDLSANSGSAQDMTKLLRERFPVGEIRLKRTEEDQGKEVPPDDILVF